MSATECDDFIYRFGDHVCILGNETAEQAEELCRKATEESGFKHDWHSFAGRKIVKKSPVPLDALNLPPPDNQKVQLVLALMEKVKTEFPESRSRDEHLAQLIVVAIG